MCGLVGVAGKSAGNTDKMFKVLLTLDVVRGEHSTGVLLVDSHGATAIHKVIGHPYGLFDSRAYTQDLAYVVNVLMGHNRYATKGVINKMNAHPFEHEHIIGAHNGTISTQCLLDDYKEFDVDSDNIYHHMKANGVGETCKLLGGAFALSWYNSADGTINFVRNDERTLYYAFTKDKKNICWASEKWMLTVAADKAHVQLGGIREFPINKHHKLFIPCAVGNKYPELKPFTVDKVGVYEEPRKKQFTVITAGSHQQGTGGKNTTNTSHFKLVGKYVDFTVIGTTPTSKHKIAVKLIDNKGVFGYVVCKKGSNLYKMLLSSVGVLFTGKVKRVNTQDGQAKVTIRQETIEEVSFTEYEAVDDYPLKAGYPSKEVSYKEWVDAVQDGCAWCSDVPQDKFEAERLTWFSSTEFVCEHCSQDIDIKRYLHLD